MSLFTGGRGYLAGTGSLELIALFYIFSAIQTIALTMLQAIGKTTQVMIVGAIGAATDVILAISLVLTFGIIGAAGSRVAVFLISAFISMYMLRNYTSGLDRARFYLKGVVSAMIPFAFTISLSYFVSSRVLTLVPYSILYFILFLVCVKVTRLLTEEDSHLYLPHTAAVDSKICEISLTVLFGSRRFSFGGFPAFGLLLSSETT